MTRQRAILLMVALTTGCSAAHPAPEGELDVTSLDPERGALLTSFNGVVALWTLRTEDCFRCPGIDAEMRSLHRVAAEADIPLSLVVIHVGRAEDSTIVRHYLRAARLDGEIFTLSPREAGRVVPDASFPDLLLAIQGRLVWRMASPLADTIPRLTATEALLTHQVRGPARETEELFGPDPELRMGQIVRIVPRDPPDGRGVLGVLGRIQQCWVAFRPDRSSVPVRQFFPVEANMYRAADVFVTADSIYDGTNDIERLVEQQEWLRLSADRVTESFVECSAGVAPSSG